jgi:hypothetical protein
MNPPGYKIGLDASSLSAVQSNSAISSWDGYAASGGPVYYSSGGGSSGSLSYVSIRASGSQYIDLGTQSFAINTNGGFTIVTYAQFQSFANNYEDFFYCGNSWNTNALYLRRYSTTAKLMSYGYEGTSQSINVQSNDVLVIGEWTMIVVRYSKSTNNWQILKDGVEVASSAPWTSSIADKVNLNQCNIGRVNGWNPSLSVNMRGFYMYDRALSDADIVAVSNYLRSIAAPSPQPTLGTTKPIPFPTNVPSSPYTPTSFPSSLLSSYSPQSSSSNFNPQIAPNNYNYPTPVPFLSSKPTGAVGNIMSSNRFVSSLSILCTMSS